MAAFIQSRQTQEFFNYERKGWQKECSDETRFSSPIEAITASFRLGLADVQLVIGQTVFPLRNTWDGTVVSTAKR